MNDREDFADAILGVGLGLIVAAVVIYLIERWNDDGDDAKIIPMPGSSLPPAVSGGPDVGQSVGEGGA